MILQIARKTKIWYQIRHHLHIEWAKQHNRVKLGTQLSYDAQIAFQFNFGLGGRVFQINDQTLSFDRLPPSLIDSLAGPKVELRALFVPYKCHVVAKLGPYRALDHIF